MSAGSDEGPGAWFRRMYLLNAAFRQGVDAERARIVTLFPCYATNPRNPLGCPSPLGFTCPNCRTRAVVERGEYG
jgi:hypothetical protein